MKKNRMMRLASVLLVLTLLTTSIISGTFAKYVTTDEGSDTARVAKWGVTVLVSGSLFGENDAPNSATDNGNEISATAQQSADSSAAGENIVAPGTQSTTGLTLSVKGTPEVANTVSVSATNGDEIYLKAGTYGTLVEASGVTEENVTDYYVENYGSYSKATAYDAGTTYYALCDAVTLAADYYPIVWTLTNGNDNTATPATATTIAGLYAEIGKAFNTSANGQNNPNVPLNATYTVTWKWEFENSNTDTAKINNGADTILGNIIANASDQVVVKTSDNGTTYSEVSEDTDYNTSIAFNVTLTVTQVD